jgi:hypothetical protein
MNFIQAFCLGAMLILLGAMLSPRVELHRAEKWMLAVFAFAIACLVLAVWLWAIRESQLAPHKIINSINGRVISSFWVTNPAYVTWEQGGVPGSPFGDAHPVTNYYWTVWSIFKK